MDENTPSSHPIVLLISPEIASTPHHDHTAILASAGYHIVAQGPAEASVAEVLRLHPRIIAAEMGEGGREGMFNLVRRLKAHPLARHIPLIVYGVGLTADEIEATAHAGAMWLQLEPKDGFKLLGAVRGILRAA